MSDAFAELNEHNDAGTPLALGAPGVFAKWVSTNIGFHRTIGNANDQGAAPGNGLIALSPGNVLDLRFNSSVNNTTLDLFHITLVVKSILRAL
ncbi:hypothetical protein LCGC14_2048710 [marine sediment metagenome]|uniref:Uncharacterized protein n=1 Tax=marine sediment metagenome TaxID=412755 RepID=A0A0F9FC66_9ZZZZ